MFKFAMLSPKSVTITAKHVFPNFNLVNPSIGELTTPKVVYAKPTLIPASIASSKLANLQNFCLAISFSYEAS